MFGLLLDGRSESECEEKSTASALSLPKKERRSRSGSTQVVVHSPEKSSESPPPQKSSTPSLKTSSLSRLAVKKERSLSVRQTKSSNSGNLRRNSSLRPPKQKNRRSSFA